MHSEFAAIKCIVAALLFALCLRLLAGQTAIFRLPQADAFAREPGSLLRPTTGSRREPPATEPPLFIQADAELVQIKYSQSFSYTADPWQLLQRELTLSLSGPEPTVLILHTHATECYTRTPEQTNFRTTDTEQNMVAVGQALAEALTQAGVGVIHDTGLHDYPAYGGAYARSRETVQRYLQEYPTICLVLDLHRDAAQNADGSQYAPTVSVAGEKTAQLMLVLGTDAESSHPNWQENLALGVKLQALLEKNTPGITRKTLLRDGRYNQDLSAGALLIEIGTAGNTLEEVYRAVPLLARAIIELAK